MSGGISQLVATGAQDVHLVGDPQVSFFRSNYKRHTNFSAVRARQVIQGGNVRNTSAASQTANGMSTVRFEKKGDLLSYTYFTKKSSAGVSEVVTKLDIDYVELYIGGQLVDTQDSNYSQEQWPQLEANMWSKGLIGPAADFFYPLHFFFCDNWTSALPLVALQYHDVEIRIYWRPGVATVDGTMECWSNFIYLDEAERRYFAENTQNMLIKQVQKSVTQGKRVHEFNLNHPVLYIGSINKQKICATAANNAAELQFNINGVQSGESMTIDPHFSRVSGYYHAGTTFTGSEGGTAFCIPFALNLNSNQPSGSLNFSRLDSSRLEITFPSTDTFNAVAGQRTVFYAVNWNVLKIEDGMGGLMYSN